MNTVPQVHDRHGRIRVVLTGATGFVGRALCHRFNEDGQFVVRAVARSSARVGRTECVAIGDIDDKTDWRPILADTDVVVHLAARVHVMRDRERDPLAAFRLVNTRATLNLARQAAELGVSRFVYFSTVKVLGERGRFVDGSIPAPVDPYGFSKLEAEIGLEHISAETGMEFVTIRPPLVFGPGVKGNFLALLEALATRRPLPLASVRNRRSFVGLGNLIDATTHCIVDPSAANVTVQICEREHLSIADLLRRIGAAMGAPPILLPCPVPLLKIFGRLAGRQAAISRLTEEFIVESSIEQRLSWRPNRTFDDELRDVAEWFRQSRNVDRDKAIE